MKWYGITGSWRKINTQVETDVRTSVREIIQRCDGIVTGGALNVDWFATDEALRWNPEATLIRVYIPVALELYAAHYLKRADEDVITHAQARSLIDQLETLKQANPNALIEHPTNTEIDKDTYYQRNTMIVEQSDVLLGFQVNNSPGVADTFDKAKKLNKEIRLNTYQID